MVPHGENQTGNRIISPPLNNTPNAAIAISACFTIKGVKQDVPGGLRLCSARIQLDFSLIPGLALHKGGFPQNFERKKFIHYF